MRIVVTMEIEYEDYAHMNTPEKTIVEFLKNRQDAFLQTVKYPTVTIKEFALCVEEIE